MREAELQLNEGVLQYEMGDYQGAMATLEPLCDSYDVADDYCQLCDDCNVDSVDPCCCIEEPVSKRKCSKRLNLSIISGCQWDSNVQQSPVFQGLGSIEEPKDSTFYLAAIGDYQLFQRDDANVGLIFSTYNNFYFDHYEFNLGDYMGGFYANRMLSDDVFAGVRYFAFLLVSNRMTRSYRSGSIKAK